MCRVLLQVLKYGSMVLAVLLAILAFYSSQHPAPSPQGILNDGGKYVELEDGRLLEYFVFGDTSGTHKHIMVEFNGMGCTGYSLREYYDEVYRSLGIYTIAITVPGLGYSTELENRQLNQWHLDVQAVLEQENITGKIWVKGSSFGTAHAMEVAAAFTKERVEGLIISGSIIPYSDVVEVTPEKAQFPPDFLLNGVTGNMFWFLMGKIAPITNKYQTNFANLFAKYPRFQDVMCYDMNRGQNHFGWVYNMKVMGQPWGFDLDLLREIDAWVIYDKIDQLAAYEQSLWLAEKIGAHAVEISGYGHASILDLENFTPVLENIFN